MKQRPNEVMANAKQRRLARVTAAEGGRETGKEKRDNVRGDI